MKLRRVLGIAAAGLVMATLTGATGSVQAAKHKHPHVARYQAGARSHTARRICFVVRYHTPPRAPRTVCRPVGGYSRLTAHEVSRGVRRECRRRPKISGRILTFPRRLSMTGRLRLPIRVGDLPRCLMGGAPFLMAPNNLIFSPAQSIRSVPAFRTCRRSAFEYLKGP